MRNRSIHKKSFTIVEILVVVGIIALIAAIAIPNLFRGRVTANDAAAKATLKSISSALENYYAINTVYPIDPNSLLGAAPPYLNTDYFTGAHSGFTYAYSVSAYAYSIIATPQSSGTGTTSFTLSTGGVIK